MVKLTVSKALLKSRKIPDELAYLHTRVLRILNILVGIPILLMLSRLEGHFITNRPECHATTL
jgi:hypothetical protein